MIHSKLCSACRGSLQLGVVLVGPPKKDRKQSIKKTKTIGTSVFTLIFWVCPFVVLSVFSGFSGCSLISHELLDKTYIYQYAQCTSSERAQ